MLKSGASGAMRESDVEQTCAQTKVQRSESGKKRKSWEERGMNSSEGELREGSGTGEEAREHHGAWRRSSLIAIGQEQALSCLVDPARRQPQQLRLAVVARGPRDRHRSVPSPPPCRSAGATRAAMKAHIRLLLLR